MIHSVIIGVSLGASESPKTIKPLVAALTFHQFFEGMGLGGCICQVFSISSSIIYSKTYPIISLSNISLSSYVINAYQPPMKSWETFISFLTLDNGNISF